MVITLARATWHCGCPTTFLDPERGIDAQAIAARRLLDGREHNTT